MKRQATLLSIAVVGVFGAGAVLEADPLPGFALAGQSEHILLYSRADSRVDVTQLERSLSRVERMLGQHYAGHLHYYHYEYREEVAAATGRYADGVTYTDLGEIHAVLRVSEHELVHALASQLGNPGNFFQEGLAVALADKGKWWGRDVNKAARELGRNETLSGLIAGFDAAAPGPGYFVAGSFVSWLIKSYGIARVGDFFRACDGGKAAPAFARVFGQSLDAAGASWRASL